LPFPKKYTYFPERLPLPFNFAGRLNADTTAPAAATAPAAVTARFNRPLAEALDFDVLPVFAFAFSSVVDLRAGVFAIAIYVSG
jgi:hypothetical protein